MQKRSYAVKSIKKSFKLVSQWCDFDIMPILSKKHRKFDKKIGPLPMRKLIWSGTLLGGGRRSTFYSTLKELKEWVPICLGVLFYLLLVPQRRDSLKTPILGSHFDLSC